jgi:hypothetical protein
LGVVENTETAMILKSTRAQSRSERAGLCVGGERREERRAGALDLTCGRAVGYVEPGPDLASGVGRRLNHELAPHHIAIVSGELEGSGKAHAGATWQCDHEFTVMCLVARQLGKQKRDAGGVSSHVSAYLDS